MRGDQGCVAQVAEGVWDELHAGKTAAQKRPHQRSPDEQYQPQEKVADLIRLALGKRPIPSGGPGACSEDISETPGTTARGSISSHDCTRFRTRCFRKSQPAGTPIRADCDEERDDFAENVAVVVK